MYVVCVTVYVKPPFVEQFKAAILENARNTRHEPGNLRFDVLQEEETPTRFFLYEVYREKDDFARHQATPHYARFRDAVADWMERPRAGVKHDKVLFYGDAEA